jgi:hypothetical protein
MCAIAAAVPTRAAYADALATLDSLITVARRDSSGVDVLCVHPVLGDTIDAVEANRYGLFPMESHLVAAVYIRLPDGRLCVRIAAYDDSGIDRSREEPVSPEGINHVCRCIQEGTPFSGRVPPPVPAFPESVDERGGTGLMRLMRPEARTFVGVAIGIVRSPENDPAVDPGVPSAETTLSVGGELIRNQSGLEIAMAVDGYRKLLTVPAGAAGASASAEKYAFWAVALCALYQKRMGPPFEAVTVGAGAGLGIAQVSYARLDTEQATRLAPVFQLLGQARIGTTPLRAFATVRRYALAHGFYTDGHGKLGIGPLVVRTGIAAGL